MPKKCIKCSKTVYCSDLCSEHFRNYFEKKVKRTIKKFDLFSRKDRLGVAVSGGKDSTVILYVLKKLGYDVKAITVDAVIGNYTRKNLENLKKVCKKYKIKLHEISFRKEFGCSLCFIKSVVQTKGLNYSSCMICGVLRRYLLNKYAKKLKFDCLVTGHNLDDEAQAFVMNVFRNDLILAKRQGPVTGSGKIKDKKSKSNVFVKRVKPLYLCTEKETIKYSKLMNFPVNYAKCPCSAGAYRAKYREMLDRFEKKFPPTKHNIIQFFLRTINVMKEKDVDKEIKIGKCKQCKEPCANTICKRCEILNALKEKKK